MKNRKKLIFAILITGGLILSACTWLDDSDSGNGSNPSKEKLTITPSAVTLAQGDTQQFSASESWGVTWSLEGSTGNSSINASGLLTVGMDETATTLTVKAEKSSYTTGTAKATIVKPSATPSGLTVTKPGSSSIALSWTALSGTSEYTIQRSANGKDFSQIGKSSGTFYTDTAVATGTSYYYRIQANGVNSPVVYTYASDYFNMPTFAQRKLIPIATDTKHYYRLNVVSGQSYTIEWQDGNNQNPYEYNSIRVSAWQNNGTSIFSNAWAGYTSPQVFTATASGFVTVEVSAYRISTSYDYQIYCYGIDGTADSGTVALPPYKVNAFRVSAPSQSSITLTWNSVSDATKYNIYRANTQNGTPGKIGESNSTTFTDNQVPQGGSFWYTIEPVNADGREGCRFQGAFGVAASHYPLSLFSSTQTYSINSDAKQYFRLTVNDGQSYTIEWQDGNNQNPYEYNSIRVSAWQNNGTSIFSNAWAGYTSPQVFTATASGFVTVEVSAYRISTSYNYQVYYY